MLSTEDNAPPGASTGWTDTPKKFLDFPALYDAIINELEAKLPARSSGLDPATARAIIAEINRLGNNINQLSKVANQTGELRRLDALDAVTEEIKAALRKVVG